MQKQDKVIRRLKSIQGHVSGILRMVEEESYCMDVVHQLLAVERAIQGVSRLILQEHLRRCVTGVIEKGSPKEREKAIDEIVQVFEANGRG